MEIDEPMSQAQAGALMAILGKAELEFAAKLVAPLFWGVRAADRKHSLRNGTAFFLDAGEGPFGVTAHHVIAEYQEQRAAGAVVGLQLSDLQIDFEGRHSIIATHEALDIATFRVSREEIESINKTVLTGHQSEWPPFPPQQGRGIYFAGFPGCERVHLTRSDISFGVASGGGIASSVSDIDISMQIERGHLIPVLGEGLPPENVNFGGISGGPMLTVTERRGLRGWSLGGVIYQGPSTSADPNEAIVGLEIIRARRAHFIRPDGTLDVARWESLQPFRGR